MTRFNRAVSIFQVILFIGVFTLAVCNADDPDLWWHMKTGEYIAAHKRVPQADLFSYTCFGQPWVAHEWLAELGIYQLYRRTGFSGLILAFAAILTAAFVFLYLRCGRAVYVAGAVTLLGAWATRPVWGVRPQVISLLFTSLWLLLLERAEKNPRLLWWTVPLMLLWVNLHAGFAVGLAVFVIFLLGALLECRLGHQKLNLPLRLALLVFAIDVLTVSLNPNGARMYSYPMQTLRSSAMQNYIVEWASPNFHRAEYLPFLLLLLATILVVACSHIPLRVRDLLLLIMSLFASLESIRMIPFFVLIAVPLISRRLEAWPRPAPQRSQSLLLSVFNAVIILAMAAFAIGHIKQTIARQPSIEAQDFPVQAVVFLSTNLPNGPIFNHYDWGGYLIWKIPSVPVFIDGRADLYGDQFFRDFAETYQFKDDWRQILQRWHVRTVLVPSNSALATGLLAERGWVVAYRDSQAIIFNASPD